MDTIEDIDRYSRQYKIIPKEDLDSAKVICIGAGVGGSWEVYMLAKMGISNIEVYDFDKVENSNIPSQLYGYKDIGKFKVDALAEKVLNDVGVQIVTHNEKVNENTVFDLSGRTIVLCSVDSVEGRKIIYNKLKGIPCFMIDGRMGGLSWYITTLKTDDETACIEYEKTLEGAFVDLPCGERAVIFSSVNLVSEEISIIKKWLRNEPIPKMVRRDYMNYFLLAKS